ncbi:MAG: DUF937 domain-containing protein [Gammaproteobacteria bacterium]
MNMIDMILNSQNGNTVGQLARQFGISENDVGNVLSQVLPALTSGIKRNASQEGGLDSLLNALGNGGHDQYLDNPDVLAQPQTIDDGNNILGHIFGSKDVSRELANRASAQTGLSSSLLKQMLPVIAGLAMGALSKRAAGSGGLGGILGGLIGGGAQGSGVGLPGAGGGLGGLGSLLDANHDGSVIDDLLGMAGKFLR